MNHLFTPLGLGPLTLDNRIIIAPMCQYSAEHGNASSWHTIHLGTLTQSGAGLLILEATAVRPEGRISPEDLGLWNDDNEAALKTVLDQVRAWSTMPVGIQLAHAGRKASTLRPWQGGAQIKPDQDHGWRTRAPSDLPFQAGEEAPEPLTEDDIGELIEAFVTAAKRAHRLGLDLIEIHGAHGYLLHEFLSPLSNQRQDRYGGSLENRMRLLLEVFEAVRDAVPEMAVGVRVSATDWAADGWDLEQTVALAKALKARGCHFIHVSSGGLTPAQKIPVGPGYQTALAARIKAESGLTTIAVGLITEPEQAETLLASGQADAVGLARGILYNPRWPWHAAARLGATAQASPQYLRSEPYGARGLFKQ
ncbi:NADH:flavin oxidoreductase [Alcanivorax xiamenensis]|uniref:NADH:flavin oxidoreductase n=1 Tax=Alcanivorax xiamenensis TaxID=1177156 RepID=A0ABQ6YCB6_9GAMM|nr:MULTISPECIES: NADH:flavin oxidoreductase/NADH oxidase [Alcanivorax]KAF0807768.1 NADH:flavin oxidoreductase [Alcanivorax xiamenensis]